MKRSMIRLLQVKSEILKNKRRMFVYLPPGWEELSTGDLPVMVMHDGQNVFADVCHEVPWQWDVDRVADSLWRRGRAPRCLIVGLANTDRRADEYTMSRSARFGCGGKADRYLDFIAHEVLPWVRREFPVSPLRQDTILAGSSLGGLVTLYAACTRSADFGRFVATSPSLWWDEFRIFRVLEHCRLDPELVTLWVDIGRREMAKVQAGGMVHRPIRAYRLLDAMLQAKGFRKGDNYFYFEEKKGRHDERSWHRRMRRALPFVLNAVPPSARALERHVQGRHAVAVPEARAMVASSEARGAEERCRDEFRIS